MSRARPSRRAEVKRQASIFAALGDETRLSIIKKLARGTPLSISGIAKGSKITRQAITKHLGVLQGAGVVQSMRAGREHRFEIRTESLREARSYLERVSEQWEDALARLKAFVES